MTCMTCITPVHSDEVALPEAKAAIEMAGLKGLVQDVLENAKDLPRMRNSICKIKDVLRYA